MRRNLLAGKRSNSGFSLNSLTDDECYELHLATLEVLEKTGMFVEDEKALEIFGDNGADIDRGRKIAKLPPYLIEDAIDTAPPKIFLAGRNPRNDFVMENNRVGFTNFGEGVNIVDPETGELRKTTKQDVADTAKVVDYLDEIDVYLRAVGAHEVPQEVAPLHNAEAFFPNTSKHCFIGPIDGFNVRKLVEMAKVVAGGAENLKERPLLSFNTCPVSPLKLVKDACEIIMEGAKNGIAVNVLSMAMAGGSTPVHMAGTLVDHNAEVLTGIALGQLTKKGTPMVYGSSTTAMDLRFGTASVGSAECGMINAAVARLGNYYGLPTWAAGG
ncbi:trimethylamine---corrinoid protein Co-methyltransferase [Desulforhopalus singaporensis]|uniref:Trimethylamine---corrinoid protein Co-methyltransferase n=1 Tax=Desulforhopalus singaporensis TaxID=91360 RepID=A0A1H0IXZ9_9BACT|nr:trimethylamine---corrinoid protein Co-methyltransferase [Desulforhopalus singaporensis]